MVEKGKLVRSLVGGDEKDAARFVEEDLHPQRHCPNGCG